MQKIIILVYSGLKMRLATSTFFSMKKVFLTPFIETCFKILISFLVDARCWYAQMLLAWELTLEILTFQSTLVSCKFPFTLMWWVLCVCTVTLWSMVKRFRALALSTRAPNRPKTRFRAIYPKWPEKYPKFGFFAWKTEILSNIGWKGPHMAQIWPEF